MTTASMLLTVATTWNVSTDKIDKEGCLGVAIKHVTAEAAKEVRESPSTKEQALAIMREWIQQNIDIKNVRQGKSMNPPQPVCFVELEYKVQYLISIPSYVS